MRMARLTLRKDCPHVIVCEGRDAENYLIWLLQALIARDNTFERFQVIDAGGIDELPLYVAAMPTLPNFSVVETLRSCFKNRSMKTMTGTPREAAHDFPPDKGGLRGV
jgi:hypothetical protein